MSSTDSFTYTSPSPFSRPPPPHYRARCDHREPPARRIPAGAGWYINPTDGGEHSSRRREHPGSAFPEGHGYDADSEGARGGRHSCGHWESCSEPLGMRGVTGVVAVGTSRRRRRQSPPLTTAYSHYRQRASEVYITPPSLIWERRDRNGLAAWHAGHERRVLSCSLRSRWL